MNPVVQKHPMGCGLACVAFVSRISYEKVFRKSKKKYASTRGYYCKELVDLLKKSGATYEYRKVTDKTKKYLRKEGSIVFIKRSKKYPAGHYLVYTKRGWMNSWINFPNMPREAGFNKRVPGTPQWIIFRK